MPLLKPPRLRAGDVVGVVAPSSSLLPAWREDYERGKETLRTLGFGVKEGRTLGLRRHWAAGTPGDQAADINAMFTDPQVKAIIALSGGFPGMAVLDRIDYDAVRAHPKPFIGMSDVTLYLLAFFARCGLVGLHADMVTHGLGDVWPTLEPSRRAYLTGLYRHVLTSPAPVGPITPART